MQSPTRSCDDRRLACGGGGGHILPAREGKAVEVFMPISRTALSVGLVASTIGVGMLLASGADARPSKQRAYAAQRAAPRGTSQSNLVCWTPCGQPGSIVMGADPDPFIRSQILRDATGFFGGSR